MVLLACLAVLLILLCTLLQKRFERMAAPFVCGVMLVAYGLALFRGLEWFVWIAGFAALCAVAWLTIRLVRGSGKELLRSFGRNFLTPGLLCFVLLSALFHAGSQQQTVIATDDIYYWGIEARSIFAHHGLVDASRHLSPRFMTYTPGMQLFQWLGLTIHGEWSEPVLYFMLWVFYLAFLLPFAQRITWKKAYWIPAFLLFALGLPALLNNDAFEMLRVDTALGICLGYALTQAWSLRKPSEERGFLLACFTLALCALVLVKQIGMAWAVMAMTLLLICRPWKAGAPKGAVLLACGAPLLVFGSWLVFSAVQNLSGVHLNDTTEYIGQMLSGTWVAPEGFSSLPGAILRVLSLPAASLSVETGRFVDIPKLVWMILFAAAPFAFIPGRREEKRTMRGLFLWTLCCFAVFLMGYVFSFMTAFYNGAVGFETWAFSYDLTERYFCPCLIGLFMLIAFVAVGHLEAEQGAKPRAMGRLLGYAVIFALILLGNDWPSVYGNLSGEQPVESVDSGPYDMYTLSAENFWVDDLEEPENAIVLYGVESYPFKLESIQYVVAPAKLVLTGNSELSQDEFLRMLREDRITHIVCMDENNPVYRYALEYSEDEWIDVVAAYRVRWEAETPVLTY